MYAPPEISESITRVTEERLCTAPWLLIVVFTMQGLPANYKTFKGILPYLSTFSVSLFSFDFVGPIKLSHLAFVDGVVFPEFEI